MPTPGPEASLAVRPIDSPASVACPPPLTPPPEPEESLSIRDHPEPCGSPTEDGNVNNAEDDNTAGGMSRAQEDSMYREQLDATPQSDTGVSSPQDAMDAETEKSSVPHDYLILRNEVPMTPVKPISAAHPDEPEPEPMSLSPENNVDA